MAGFDGSDACGIQATHLACTHTHGHAVGAKNNRVALDVLGDGPRKQQVMQLLLRGLLLRHHLHVVQSQTMVISGLHQQA